MISIATPATVAKPAPGQPSAWIQQHVVALPGRQLHCKLQRHATVFPVKDRYSQTGAQLLAPSSGLVGATPM